MDLLINLILIKIILKILSNQGTNYNKMVNNSNKNYWMRNNCKDNGLNQLKINNFRQSSSN